MTGTAFTRPQPGLVLASRDTAVVTIAKHLAPLDLNGVRIRDGGKPRAALGVHAAKVGGYAPPTLRQLGVAASCRIAGYGSDVNDSTLDGSVPLLQTLPVTGTVVGLSICVRSTRTISLASPLTRSAIASPPLGD